MAEGARSRQWARLLVQNCVAIGIALGGTAALMRSTGGSSWFCDIALAARFVLPPTLVVAIVSGIILWGRVPLGAAEMALSVFVIVLAGTQGGFYLMMIAAASASFGPGGGG